MANRSHKSFFMPMLCRFSLNDTVKPPKLTDPSTTDPSSPKLTCIGQIKKRSTTTTTTTTTNHNHHHHHSNRYTKLHRLFSGKNLISPAIDTNSINKLNKSVTKRSKSCNGRNRIPINKQKYYIDDQDIVKVVVEQELDPPLPVVKCRYRDQESNLNLWKRRGIEMKSLQIQPIQLTLNRNTSSNNGGFLCPSSATTY